MLSLLISKETVVLLMLVKTHFFGFKQKLND